MLLNYNYDNANKVLAMFNEGKLATLNIERPVSNEKKFVMNYTLVTEYPSDYQMKIKRAMSNPNSYPVRIKVTELFNQFIENQATDTVIEFSLYFTAVDSLICKCTSKCQFGGNNDCVTGEQIEECIDDLDGIITKLGIGSVKVDNWFKKEGAGKNKRNVPLTLTDLSIMIRHALMGE